MKNSFRNVVLLYLLTLLFSPSLAQENEDGSKITFDHPLYNFGDIAEGDTVSHSFKFKNTGNQPLVISNVVSTCGCTATKWPKEPVPPGKSGEIKVDFDASGRRGKQSKVITVISNSFTPQARIRVTANVLPGNT